MATTPRHTDTNESLYYVQHMKARKDLNGIRIERMSEPDGEGRIRCKVLWTGEVVRLKPTSIFVADSTEEADEHTDRERAQAEFEREQERIHAEEVRPHYAVVERLLRSRVTPDIASLIVRDFDGGTHKWALAVKEAIDNGQSFPDSTILSPRRCDCCGGPSPKLCGFKCIFCNIACCIDCVGTMYAVHRFGRTLCMCSLRGQDASNTYPIWWPHDY